jgi:hypothetical protein
MHVVVKGEVSAQAAPQISYTYKLPPGIKDPKDVDLRKLPLEAMRLVGDAGSAFCFAYTYGGGTRRVRVGDRLHVPDDEYLFASNRYPGLLEPLPSDVQSASDSELALIENVKRQERVAQVAVADLERAQGELEQAKTDRARFEAKALEYVTECERLKTEIEDLKLQLTAAKAKAPASDESKTAVDTKAKAKT